MNLLQMSLSASVLILMAVAFRKFFSDRIPRTVFSLLWLLAWWKLMIPVPTGFPVPVAHSLSGKMPDITAALPFSAGTWQTAGAGPDFGWNLLKILWLCGAVAVSLYIAYIHAASMKKYRTAILLKKSSWIPMWLEQKRSFRRITVRVSDEIDSPLTYGIFFPVILLPKQTDWADNESMNLILEHEAAHIRHLDALKKLCLTISCVCHWFNPLVWLMAALACRDMELACDEAVVRAVGGENRKLYADLLVELEAKRAGIHLLTSGFGQSLIRERIFYIMKKKEKVSLTGILFSLAMVISCITVYGAMPSGTFSLNFRKDDPTLGGIFELYSVEEYQRIVDAVKADRGEKDPDAVAMERDLNRLKADNGKGEYVIYKGAFLMETETVMVSFNPTIVMRPELMNRNVPLTAETYRNDMTEVAEILDDAIADGFLTEAQKKRVMDKMDENLAGIKSAPVP
ncbi:Regulatory protein BlaR1 [Acetatifactor muris]|uniref:Regulatory protein BlaR1 n=2 Tax=Acetatifactor muris TaxID=879566 RepID=A0A2K4ZBM5_9FIRM|nr:Regulatory protein BlaR1 [Acetatifactor muris]